MTILPSVVLLAVAAAPPEWDRLPPLPDANGFAGSFAGVTGRGLVVAGGANFPAKKPWDGGTKVWSDGVYLLDRPAGKWTIAGRLPRTLAYGVSVTHHGGVVCVGGCDSARHYADAFRLEHTAGKVIITPLPPLPRPLAYSCGALVGNSLYVAGGREWPNGPATAAAYRLDLAAAAPKWEEIAACPGGGRMLAVAASFDGAFWMIGGAAPLADGTGRRYLKDVYRYDPGRGWSRMPDLPYSLAAAPSPAPVDETGLFVFGGDDGTDTTARPDHPGFRRSVLRFDGTTWKAAGEVPAPRVTTPAVAWASGWVVPTGEVRPGVRSPEVWRWTPLAR